MSRLTSQKGVALLLTISLLTALTILGISFISLLHQDMKMSQANSDLTASAPAIEAAVNVSLAEIKKQLGSDNNYFFSEIEVASPDSSNSVPMSPLYFKSTIRATNAKLSLYQGSCEVMNTLRSLIDELPITEKDNLKKIFNKIGVYQSDWEFNSLADFMTVKLVGIADKSNMIFYEALSDYVTTNPQSNEGVVVNIIDYGKCVSATASTFKADKRDFYPVTGQHDALRGARIEIISGEGYDPTNPNYAIIDKVDTANPDTLILQNGWTGTTPTDKSIYRIYSYVVPINFNAAPKELIKAQFELVEPVIQKITGGTIDFIGLYNNSRDDLLYNRLFCLREESPLSSFSSRVIKDAKQFKDLFLLKIFTINDEKEIDTISRLFDHTKPKGVYDGTNWLIYPQPVPFCFEHNGYFDMEIVAGMKRDPSLKKAKHLIDKYVTVKVGGQSQQNLREDFEVSGAVQHWVTTDDYVPVEFLNDINSWERITRAIFQPYSDYNATNKYFVNTMPDAIKNGLWFDFSANQDLRGESFVYSQLTNQLEKTKNIYSSDFFTVISGSPVVDNSGEIEIKGAGSPEVEIVLGDPSKTEYDFEEMSAMVNIKDSSPLVTGTTPFPCPDDASFYSGGNKSSHTWEQHSFAVTSPNRRCYPPERFFTPNFFMRKGDVSGNDYSIDFRAEHKYVKDQCSTNLDAYYDSNNDFSISMGTDNITNYFTDGYYYHENASYQYLEKYNLFTSITKTTSTLLDVQIAPISPALPKIITTNFQDINGSGVPELSDGNPFSNIPDKGKVGFKRFFPVNYFRNGNSERPFLVESLRIIAGPKDVSGSKIYPFYQSKLLNVDDIKKYRYVKVYYSVGSREDSKFQAGDEFQFSMSLKFDSSSSSSSSSLPVINSTHVVIDENSTYPLEGVFSYDISSVGALPQYKYKINIINHLSGTDKDKTFNYLKSTIAITKVEVVFDTEEKIISVNDNI